jgi:hypothetical protein
MAQLPAHQPGSAAPGSVTGTGAEDSSRLQQLKDHTTALLSAAFNRDKTPRAAGVLPHLICVYVLHRLLRNLLLNTIQLIQQLI